MLLALLGLSGCALFDDCEPAIDYSNAPGLDGEGCVDLEFQGHPSPATWYPLGTGANVETCHKTLWGTGRSFVCEAGGRWVELL